MKNKIIRGLSLFKIIIQSMIYKNRVYIFGTPFHGNIGDQAILIAEEKFLRDKFPKEKVICVESKIVKKEIKILKKIVKKSLILISGGGFIGSTWLQEEEMFRLTINNFSNNNIIVFPQTIYFSNDAEGKRILEESKKIYNSHKNLYFCCREEYSYNFMKREFPNCNIILVPDMVLYLDEYKDDIVRNNILFCLRSDKEKINNNLDKILYLVKDYKVDYTDTVIKKMITGINKGEELKKKLKEFRSYKLAVVDRLHGMIFALLTGTPCIVFNNANYKIKGVYKWIEKINYIKFYNEETIDKDFNYLINLKENHYDNTNIREKYIPLINLISKKIK